MALNQNFQPGSFSTFDMKSRMGSQAVHNDNVSNKSGKTNKFLGTTNLTTSRSNYEKNAISVAKSKKVLEAARNKAAMNDFVNFSHMYTNTHDNRSGTRTKDFSNPNSHRAHMN